MRDSGLLLLVASQYACWQLLLLPLQTKRACCPCAGTPCAMETSSCSGGSLQRAQTCWLPTAMARASWVYRRTRCCAWSGMT